MVMYGYRIYSVLLCCVVIFCAVGCGNDEGTAAETTQDAAVDTGASSDLEQGMDAVGGQDVGDVESDVDVMMDASGVDTMMDMDDRPDVADMGVDSASDMTDADDMEDMGPGVVCPPEPNTIDAGDGTRATLGDVVYNGTLYGTPGSQSGCREGTGDNHYIVRIESIGGSLSRVGVSVHIPLDLLNQCREFPVGPRPESNNYVGVTHVYVSVSGSATAPDTLQVAESGMV